MTIRHVTDYYMDGHIAISYCKVCSKEGQELLETCSGKPSEIKKYINPNIALDEKITDR